MKKVFFLLSLVLLGAVSCTAQLPAEYRGEYKASLDSEGLLASLSDTTSDKHTITTYTVTRTSNSSDGSDFQQEAQRKAKEIIENYTAQGYTLASANSSMQTSAYDIITIKAHSIENANPLTKQTEVLYEWKDKDVTPLENGYRIQATNGTTFTLERINPTQVRILELHLILTSTN